MFSLILKLWQRKQAAYCHLQNYKEMLEPQQGKDHLLMLKRNGPKIDPCGTLEISLDLILCVVLRIHCLRFVWYE